MRSGEGIPAIGLSLIGVVAATFATFISWVMLFEPDVPTPVRVLFLIFAGVMYAMVGLIVYTVADLVRE